MHNRIGFNRLDRRAAHRRALHRNMVTSLIKYERITTTKAKAKEIRRTAEKLVTRAKIDSVHNRRIAAKFLFEKTVLHKLFTEVGPRFVERPGGYTRILKLGQRSGDAAEMVILEFLKEDEQLEPKKKTAKKAKSSAGDKKKAQQSGAVVSKESADKATIDDSRESAPAVLEEQETVQPEGAADDSVKDSRVSAESNAQEEEDKPEAADTSEAADTEKEAGTEPAAKLEEAETAAEEGKAVPDESSGEKK